jgi:hypothetical protein
MNRHHCSCPASTRTAATAPGSCYRTRAGNGRSYTGAVIGRVGIPAPARTPETVTVIELLAD